MVKLIKKGAYMTAYNGSEKRRHKRIYKNFFAKIRFTDEIFSLDGWHMVSIKNLSAGGAFFTFDKPVSSGAFLDMSINFPVSRNPIECKAKIIRLEKDPQLPLLGVAAQFMEMSEEDRALIDDAAENIYSKK